MTSVIDRLNTAGSARRVPDPNDPRRVRVAVTPASYAVAERIWGPMAADRVGPTQTAISRALRSPTARCDTILVMSQRAIGRGEDERLRFIADPAVLNELGVTIDQLADPDMRSLVIRGEHPEFEEALDDGLDEIDGDDGPMNPRLHLAMHEIVATQLWDDSPPEVWDTAVRLIEAGYERDEILHMLASPVAEQVWGALHDKRPYDRERHLAALQALPGSWERERTTRTAVKRHDDARKQARRAARAGRRANRRPR